MSVFVKIVALGKWSDALMSAELQPCADWPVAGWECRLLAGKGATEFGSRGILCMDGSEQ